MNSPSKPVEAPIEVRRCRPLLGTFVEITASGLDTNRLNAAIDDAFAAIQKIQTQMSVHDAHSELSRLNREAALHPVTVSQELFSVLCRADALASESGGAFDYTVAPVLARWGYLPEAAGRQSGGDWRQVLLLRGRKVYFLSPLTVDLGGIAKGFAVDQAVKALQKKGALAAVVNAGGDLRVFGSVPSIIHLRHPENPQLFANQIQLQESALATSSPCFTERDWQGQRVSHLVNSLCEKAVTGVISVSVKARECWLADALTKVVLNAPERAQKLLAKYQAEAYMMTA